MNESKQFLTNLYNKFNKEFNEYRKLPKISFLSGHEDYMLSCEPWEGDILFLLTLLTNPKSILEVGCANGYSATQLGTALHFTNNDGKLFLCEISDDYRCMIEKKIKMAGIKDVSLIIHNFEDYHYMDTVLPKNDIGMIFVDRNSDDIGSYNDLTFIQG
jgi:predicted O-methyltransferase YrrM